jgi:hypothetical protein
MSSKEHADAGRGSVPQAAPLASAPAKDQQSARQQSQELSGGVPSPGGSAAGQANELSNPRAGWASDDPAALARLHAGYPDPFHAPPSTPLYRYTHDPSGGIGQNGTSFWQTQPNDAYAGPDSHLLHTTVGEVLAHGELRLDPKEPAQDSQSISVMAIHRSTAPQTVGQPVDSGVVGFDRAGSPLYAPGHPWHRPATGAYTDLEGTRRYPDEGDGLEQFPQWPHGSAVAGPPPAKLNLKGPPKANPPGTPDNEPLDFARHAPAMRGNRPPQKEPGDVAGKAPVKQNADPVPTSRPAKMSQAEWDAWLAANGTAHASGMRGTAEGGQVTLGHRATTLDGKSKDQTDRRVVVGDGQVMVERERLQVDSDGREVTRKGSVAVNRDGHVLIGGGAQVKNKDGAGHGVSGQADLHEGKASVNYAGSAAEREVTNGKGLVEKRQVTWGAGGGMDLADDGTLEGYDGQGKVGYAGASAGASGGVIDSVKITGEGPFIVTWTEGTDVGVEGGAKGATLSHQRSQRRVRTRSVKTRAEAEALQRALRSGERPEGLAAGETLQVESKKKTGLGLSAILPGASLSAGGSVATMAGWTIHLSADGKTLIVRERTEASQSANLGADSALLGAQLERGQSQAQAVVYHIPLEGAGRAEFERLKAAGFTVTPAEAWRVGTEHTDTTTRGTTISALGGQFKKNRTRTEGVEIDDATGARQQVSTAGATSGFTGPKLPGAKTALGPRMSNDQQARFATDAAGQTTGQVDGAVDFSAPDGQAQALAEATGGRAPDTSMINTDEVMVPVATRTDLTDADQQRAIRAIRAGKVDLFAAAGGGVTTDTGPMLALQKRLLATRDPDAERRAIADYLDAVKDEQDGLAQLRRLSGAQTWVVPKGHEDVFWPKAEYERVRQTIEAAAPQGSAARLTLDPIRMRVQAAMGKLDDTTGYLTQMPVQTRQAARARMDRLRQRILAILEREAIDPTADPEVQEAQRQTRAARGAVDQSTADAPLVAESNPHLHRMAKLRGQLKARRATLRKMWTDTRAQRGRALHAMKMHTGAKGESASWMGGGLNARSVVGEDAAYAEADNHRKAADEAWSLAARMQAQIDVEPDAGAPDEQVATGRLEGQLQNVTDLIDTYRKALVAYQLSADVLDAIRARTEADHPRAYAGYDQPAPEQADVAMPSAFVDTAPQAAKTNHSPSPQALLARHAALDAAKAALGRAKSARRRAHGLAVYVHRTFIHGHETAALWKAQPRFMEAFRVAENRFRTHDRALATLEAQGLGARLAQTQARAEALKALADRFDGDYDSFRGVQRMAQRGAA